MTTLQVESLTKRYGAITAVERLSFEAEPGRVTGFLGPNGSGKTTTLRILLGLAEPTAGRATFDGRRYDQLQDPIRRVGALITDDTFHPGRTGAQHLDILAIAGGIPRTRVAEVLETVGLTPAAERKVGGYSLGMRQRLGLAAALLGDPEVIVLDEPLNGLDPDGIVWTRSLLRHLAGQGRTVLLSSHLLAEVSVTVDDIVVIANGQLRAAGPLADLSRAATTVRATRADVLAAGLARAGHPTRWTGPDTLEVSDVGPDVVGEIALELGVALLHLSEQRDDLERLFHELTQEVPA